MHRFILLLALASGLANAANAADGAAPKPAECGKQRADKADTAPAAAVDDEAKARPKPEPKPRRPDTAGWRRIMAGSGRT